MKRDNRYVSATATDDNNHSHRAHWSKKDCWKTNWWIESKINWELISRTTGIRSYAILGINTLEES